MAISAMPSHGQPWDAWAADIDTEARTIAGKATPADITAASTADRARANHTGTQATSTVTGLDTALAGKATNEPRVINFATTGGGDRTGATTCDTAIAAIISAATTAAPVEVFFAPGTYRFDAPWPTIDPQAVRFRGAGAFHSILDFSRLTTGPAVDVQKSTSNNTKHVVMVDLNLLGPSSPSTTVDAFSLGSNTTFANQCVFERVRCDGFRDHWLLNSNTWCIDWISCYSRNAARYGISSIGAITSQGEGLRWIGGTFSGTGGDCLNINASGTIDVVNASLDYSNHIATVRGGSRINFVTCHFEVGDAQTGDSMITMYKSDGFNSAVTIKSCTLAVAYTSAGSVKTFVRLLGTGGAVNDNGVLIIDGLSVWVLNGQTGVNALVIDNSVAASNNPATKESHIVLRGIAYRDAGGVVGGLYPFYVLDRAGRKHLIGAGIDYGNLIYDLPQRSSGWTFPVPHTFETIPRQLAVTKFAPASGDLYLMRLPSTGGEGFVATASNMLIAIGAVAAGLTTSLVGLYDLGPEVNPSTSLTRFFQSNGADVTSTPNVVRAATNAATVTWAYPRAQYFAAVLFVGTTPPELWGMKPPTASPLLDPQSSLFPFTCAKLTGQTGLPTSITVSSLAKTDFLPWMAFKPTSY